MIRIGLISPAVLTKLLIEMKLGDISKDKILSYNRLFSESEIYNLESIYLKGIRKV